MKPLALVIENDRGTRKLLDVLLTRAGFDVDLVAFGRDALVLLQNARYDLLHVDLLLPDLAGMQVLEWVERERPALLDRTLVISSAPMPQVQQVRDRWPLVHLIRKPFELAEVMEVAQQLAQGWERHTPTFTETFCRSSIRAGAKAGVIAASSGAPQLELLHSFGYAPGELEPYFPMPLDAPMPVCTAIRKGSPVWLPSPTLAAAEYPLLAKTFERHGSRALAVVPLLRDARLVGAVSWSFREPRLFTRDEQQVFVALATTLAADVGRASARPAPGAG